LGLFLLYLAWHVFRASSMTNGKKLILHAEQRPEQGVTKIFVWPPVFFFKFWNTGCTYLSKDYCIFAVMHRTYMRFLHFSSCFCTMLWQEAVLDAATVKREVSSCVQELCPDHITLRVTVFLDSAHHQVLWMEPKASESGSVLILRLDSGEAPARLDLREREYLSLWSSEWGYVLIMNPPVDAFHTFLLRTKWILFLKL
jgi:hypothetical protein